MIHVLLPVYNEEGALPPLLDGIRENLDGFAPYEVVAVNDGSTDGSARVIKERKESMPVTLLEHGRNMGLGAAIRTGFDYLMGICGDGDIIVTLDADNSHDPALIRDMVKEVGKGAELVIASRFVGGGGQVGLALHRRALSRGFGLFIRVIGINYPVKDWTCGYRAYRCGVLKRLRESYGDGYITSQGFVVMFEVLFKLIRACGVRPVEVPLVLRYDKKIGRSKIRVVRTILQYLSFVLKETVSGRRPGRVRP